MTAITPAYAHAFQATCLSPHIPGVPSKTSGCPRTKPDIRIFPMLAPQHVKEAMISVGGLLIQMEVLALLMVKLLLDGVLFHDPLMEELMSCLVLSSPPRLISLSQVTVNTTPKIP